MAAIAQTLLLSSLVAIVLPSTAMGAVFLGNRGPHHGLSDLLQDLERAAGRDHRLAAESRVDRLEQALQPMYMAMPKDIAGRLDSVGVRYLLHRLFVQRHGWFVNGLDTGGDAWNSSSPAAVFKNVAGEHHNLFDDKLRSHGFTLHQVAVFAATLETLVHGENLERLQVAYRLLGLSRSESLSESEAAEVIRSYMLILVRLPEGMTMSSLTRTQLRLLDRKAVETYQTWLDTEEFARGIRQRILEDVAGDERTTWDTNLKVVEEIGERYGRWQDKECHVLKGMLLEMERPGTGRVHLEDFYGPALHNKSWQFTESVQYLRKAGALDESDPRQATVIIPNYLNAPANCVASSKFYSVCCIDRCEDLLGALEKRIAAPDATPAHIAELVAALPAETVQAPRILPALLMQRLEEIAKHHGGRVPLHGRLFAQWLHHAYPHECPYPHISGTTNPLTPMEWMARSDEPLDAGEEEIRRILNQSQPADPFAKDHAEGALPWHAEEELFVSRPELPQSKNTSAISRGLTLMGIPLFAAFMLLRPRAPGKSKEGFTANHKYYV